MKDITYLSTLNNITGGISCQCLDQELEMVDDSAYPKERIIIEYSHDVLIKIMRDHCYKKCCIMDGIWAYMINHDITTITRCKI